VGVSYLHADHLGSVSVASGAQAGGQTFGPWGNVTSGSTSATSMNYTGQRLDSASGLLYYHARYYDATLARFISADSVVPGQTATTGTPNPQQLNRYSYVANNPLTYNDPTGHVNKSGESPDGPMGGTGTGGDGTAPQGPIDPVVEPVVEPIVEPVEAAPPTTQMGPEGLSEAPAVENPAVEGTVHPLKARADELHGLLDPVAQNRRTTGIVRTTDPEGNQVDVVSSSNRRLDPNQRAALKLGEVEGIGSGHAEQTGLDYADRHGLTPKEVAASRPICGACADAIDMAGARPVSPLKNPR